MAGKGQAKLNEAMKILDNLDDPHGRRAEVGDVMAVVRLLADTAVSQAADIAALRAGRSACGTANPCCGRAGEYNGFGSDGPLTFVCPKHCPCHD